MAMHLPCVMRRLASFSPEDVDLAFKQTRVGDVNLSISTSEQMTQGKFLGKKTRDDVHNDMVSAVDRAKAIGAQSVGVNAELGRGERFGRDDAGTRSLAALPMPAKRKPAVFLDRDGTIIEDRGHLGTPSEVVFYPDTVRSLRNLQEHFLLFIVTHQPGISGGIVRADEVEQVNEHVVAELRRHGVVISEVYCCPHRREEQCACIKPRPFFLAKAAGEYGLSLARSFVVGDHPHDVTLADNAGSVGIYVLSGHGARHRAELPPRTIIVPGIREAADRILAYRPRDCPDGFAANEPYAYRKRMSDEVVEGDRALPASASLA